MSKVVNLSTTVRQKWIKNGKIAVQVNVWPKSAMHYDPTVKDSPQPQASIMLGFLNVNLELRASSVQSISLPMIEKSALLSISTFTPSCSATSSNFPGSSTYSRWYESPAQPLFRTPIRISCGVGPLSRPLSLSTAFGVIVSAAFVERILGLGFSTLGADGGRAATWGAAASANIFEVDEDEEVVEWLSTRGEWCLVSGGREWTADIMARRTGTNDVVYDG